MRLAGVVPEDEPDPRIAQAESLKMMPVPVYGRSLVDKSLKICANYLASSNYS